jgi:hypothetical protein
VCDNSAAIKQQQLVFVKSAEAFVHLDPFVLQHIKKFRSVKAGISGIYQCAFVVFLALKNDPCHELFYWKVGGDEVKESVPSSL